MTEFFKLSGSGNDFLALAEPAAPPAPEEIRAWCRRGVSLGADGLFILRRRPDGADMEYFNADGLPADLCLNGTRCAAQLAFHLGWADAALAVRTGAGTVAARRRDATRVTLELPAPATPQPLAVTVDGIARAGFRLRVGVPHFVLPWAQGLAGAPVRELGAAIRGHAAFGREGTNVNFVRFPERHRVEVRTFERGVEDETLSCGTAVLAAASPRAIWSSPSAPSPRAGSSWRWMPSRGAGAGCSLATRASSRAGTSSLRRPSLRHLPPGPPEPPGHSRRGRNR